MSDTVELARQLIACPSVTPNDAGCQTLLSSRLEPLGFTIEPLRFGEVDNFWARRGSTGPLFVFAGHTDVVPTGPLAEWASDPFQPQIRDGYLYGRGAADMKSSLAAMITACEHFVSEHPDHQGSIGFLITSDEEGPAIDGTIKVVEHLQARGDSIDWCLVGEPTSNAQLADVIKNGRRGSLNGRLVVLGHQGHVAYPELAENPVHQALPALQELCACIWDHGNAYFPPTTFQISNIHAGTGATNVIPGSVTIDFNFRYSTEQTALDLCHQVETLLDRHGLDYRLEWVLSGQPFLTEAGELVAAAQRAISEITGLQPQLSTSGGTSDGRFIAPSGAQVIELGPVNATIHKVNESIKVADIPILADIYYRILRYLLAK